MEDPLVMWLVVRHVAHPDPAPVWWERAWHGVLRACDAFAGDPTHDAWVRTSYRKVTLRAKGGEWPRLLEAEPDAIVIDDAMAVVRPRRRSDAPRHLTRLNVCRWSDDDLPALAPGAEPPDHAVGCLVRASVPMGVGKQIAQVAHGAMHADLRLRFPAEQAWRDAGRPVHFRRADDLAWAAAKRSPHEVVRDAGLTEVDPGTETVLVSGYLTPMRSTTKTSVSSGPITPPAPRLP